MTSKGLNSIYVRNFFGGLIHGAFFAVSSAFADTNTVLPAYIGLLSGSSFYVGVLTSILIGGSVLPQLYFSYLLEPKRFKKPWLMAGIIIRVFSWLVLGILTHWLGDEHPRAILYSLFFLLLVFSVAGSMAGVAFNDIFGRSIRPAVRGTFFASRQLLGSLLAFSAGYMTRAILRRPDLAFPHNYAYLFILAGFSLAIGAVGFALLQEPPLENPPPPRAARDYFREIVALLHQDRAFVKFLTVQNLTGVNLLALPFYVVFARQVLHLTGEAVGTFVMYQVAGAALSNFLWAYLNDRFSSKLVLQAALAVEVAVPLTAFLFGSLAPAYFHWTFFLIGAGASGRQVAFNTYLIDLSPTERRVTYTGLQGTLTSPTLIFPFLGGILADAFGYQSLFAVVAALLFGTGFLTLSLPKVRA